MDKIGRGTRTPLAHAQTDIFLGGNFHAIARKVNYRIFRAGTWTRDVSWRSQCALRRLGCSRKSSRMPFLDTRER